MCTAAGKSDDLAANHLAAHYIKLNLSAATLVNPFNGRIDRGFFTAVQP